MFACHSHRSSASQGQGTLRGAILDLGQADDGALPHGMGAGPGEGI